MAYRLFIWNNRKEMLEGYGDDPYSAVPIVADFKTYEDASVTAMALVEAGKPVAIDTQEEMMTQDITL